MKPTVALLISAIASGWALAQTAPTPTPGTPDPRAPTPSTSKAKTTAKTSAPGSATAPKSTAGAKTTAGATKSTGAKGAADKAAKKEEPPPKIEGKEIARGAKGFLGLQVVDGTFKLNFYDAKKKPIAPDVARAVLRWTPSYKPGTEVYVLGPGADGKSLTAPKVVRPPYQFKLFLSLFADGGENPTDSFVIDFAQ
jgi:hypothetical protein